MNSAISQINVLSNVHEEYVKEWDDATNTAFYLILVHRPIQRVDLGSIWEQRVCLTLASSSTL